MKKIIAFIAALTVALAVPAQATAASGTATAPALVRSTTSGAVLLNSPDVLSKVTVDGPAVLTMTSLRQFTARATTVTQVVLVVSEAGVYDLRDRCGYSAGATHRWTVLIDGVAVASALLKCA